MKNSQSLESMLSTFMQRVAAETNLLDARASVTMLQGDGSDRSFFRIRQEGSHYIGLVSPRKKLHGLEENDSYYLIGKHLLRRDIPVPQIHWADLREGFFLLEDFGDFHLQWHAVRRRTNRWKLYRLVLKLLVTFHQRAPRGFHADFCFDGSIYSPVFVYERELEYFRKAFLNTYLELDVGVEDLRDDFETLAAAAGVSTQASVMHRDFQSRNIMIKSGKLGLLDFQGVRFGPPAYDLASLLLDPYVELPYRLQEQLAGVYWTAARTFLPLSAGHFMDSFRAVRLCRNLQVLGAYGFLGCVKGKAQFLRYITRAWEQLEYCLRGGEGDRLPKLRKWVSTIQRHRWNRVGKSLHSKSFA